VNSSVWGARKTVVLDPRLIAIANLQQVVDGRSLDAVLADAPTELSDSDRALAAEFSYGLCRWYRQCHAIVAARLKKPMEDKDRDLHFLLMLGVYQLLHSRTPAHAAISTSVELTRTLKKEWASKVVNAILRGVQRDQESEDSPLFQQINGDLSLKYAQPKWFVKAMAKAWPKQQEKILEALQERAPMTLRVNGSRIGVEAYLRQLDTEDIVADALPVAPDAVVLQKPQPVNRLPGFFDGLASVQDAGAQLAARLLDVQSGQRILDACAAPGGKTGHILELADNLDVVAVDVDERRLERVSENLQRLQFKAELIAADAGQPPSQWQEKPFDRILIDAPCSATGVMRRHPDIRLLRRAQDVDALAERQAVILEALWPCLATGGKLLYVTCSLMPQENTQQIERFLQKYPQARSLPLSDDWGHECRVGRQTLPGEKTMDGFYYALLEKIDGPTA